MRTREIGLFLFCLVATCVPSTAGGSALCILPRPPDTLRFYTQSGDTLPMYAADSLLVSKGFVREDSIRPVALVHTKFGKNGSIGVVIYLRNGKTQSRLYVVEFADSKVFQKFCSMNQVVQGKQKGNWHVKHLEGALTIGIMSRDEIASRGWPERLRSQLLCGNGSAYEFQVGGIERKRE